MRSAIINAVFVGSGGFIGALLRYGLSGLVQGRSSGASLVVNLIGCLVIGVFAGLVDARQVFSPEIRTVSSTMSLEHAAWEWTWY